MPPPSPHAPPDIPDYELLRQVGRGSYGDVWLARSVTGLYRAVKIVWRSRFEEAHPYEREFSGLRAFARISITESRQLALLHVGRNDLAGFFYYVMELADDAERGRDIDPERYTPLTLKRFRERGHRLPIATVVTHAIELARALSTLHGRGLVHRDIKPSNIILVDGQPKLADIGLITAATSAMTFVGTEGFVPPEGPGTPAADVFSFGKLLYELATGRDRQDFPQLPQDFAARDDRRELMELNEVILRACEPEIKQRYADAGAMLEDLLLLHAGRSVRRLRLTERGLARARRAAVLLLVLSTVAAGGVFLERQRAERESAGRRSAEAQRDLLLRQNLYAARLARAQRALELGDLGRARLALGAAEPDPGETDLRGFEWYALMADASGDPASILRDVGPAVRRVCFSPDGSQLAVGDVDFVVTLFDTATRTPKQRITGIHRLTGFSADGRWLLGTDPNYRLSRWSVANGNLDLASQCGGVNRPLQTSPTGNRLATFTDGIDHPAGNLRIWDFDTLSEVSRMPVTGPVSATQAEVWQFYRAAIAPDLRHAVVVLIAGVDRQARWSWQLIDLETLSVVNGGESPAALTAIAFEPDGKHFAFLDTGTGMIQLGDSATGTLRELANGGRGSLAHLVFSPDGQRFALGGVFPTVRIGDTATGEMSAVLRGHAGGMNDATWSPLDGSLVTGGTAGDVRWWSSLATRPRAEFMPQGRPQNATNVRMLLGDAGRRLGLILEDDKLQLFNTNAMDPLGVIDDVRWPLRLTAAGELWWVDTEGRLRRKFLHETTVSVAPRALTNRPGLLLGCNLSPDGKAVFVGQSDEISLHDADTGIALVTVAYPRNSSGEAAFSPDGRSFVTFNSDLQLHRWDTTTGSALAIAATGAEAIDATFSPDGSLLAVTTNYGEVEIRDGASLALLQRLPVTSASISPVVFSPDGLRLLIGASSGTVQVFSTADWREVTSLVIDVLARPEQRDQITQLRFNQRGDTLAVATEGGRAKVWHW